FLHHCGQRVAPGGSGRASGRLLVYRSFPPGRSNLRRGHTVCPPEGVTSVIESTGELMLTGGSGSAARSARRRPSAGYCVAILKFRSDSLSSTPVVATKAPFFAFQRQVSLTAVLLYFGGFWPSPQSDSPGLVSVVKVMMRESYSDPVSGRVA